MTLPSCKLCLNKPADKKNSHIIPKFLCKSLFELTKPRHAIIFDKTLKARKVQDTLKENHIVCYSCEKRIEILETYFSRVIEDIHNYKKLPQKFPISKLGTQAYIECKELDPILFKIFLYSLVWRASISNLYECVPFKLDLIDEERIRNILDSTLSLSKNKLFENIKAKPEVPMYHNCIIKPKDKSRGILSIASMSNSAHALFLIDFAIFFYTDEESIGDVLIKFSNKENIDVKVALGELPAWTRLNELFVTKMVNSKKSG